MCDSAIFSFVFDRHLAADAETLTAVERHGAYQRICTMIACPCTQGPATSEMRLYRSKPEHKGYAMHTHLLASRCLMGT